MIRLLKDYRGTRRNLPFARVLLATVVAGAFVVGATLGLGLWTSMHSGNEVLDLMTVGVSEPATSATDENSAATPTVAWASPLEAPGRRVPVTSPVTAALRGDVADTPPALPAVSGAAGTEEAVVMFDGRPLRRVKALRMKTTAYSPDARSCGKWADGITASGYSVWTNGGKLVAADTSVLPFGTIVSIPGYHGGKPVPVLDRGGAIKNRRLDLLYPTHEAALQWGVQDLDVVVWEYAD